MKQKSMVQLWEEFCGGKANEATLEDWEAFRKVTFARWCLKSGLKLSYADVYNKFVEEKEYVELMKIKSSIEKRI